MGRAGRSPSRGAVAARGRALRAAAFAIAAGLVAGLAGCGGSPPATLTGCEPAQGLTPHCGFHNPEDLAVAPGGQWLLVSQFPELGGGGGGLLGWLPDTDERRPLYPDGGSDAPLTGVGDPACPGPPDRASFSPHGIDVARDGGRLLVVNHGGREAVEIFALASGDDGAPRLTWSGCVPLPSDAVANDVASLPEDGFLVTRMVGSNQLLASLEILLGWNTGYVLAWQPEAGFHEVPGTDGVAPNGVAASADGRTLWFSEWGAERVVRVARDGAARAEAPLSFHPDNLTWTPDGRLLAAGQRAPVTAIPGCRSVKEGACGLASGVAAIDPEGMRVDPWLDHDPATVLGAASVALLLEGRVYVGTFAGDRIVTFYAP